MSVTVATALAVAFAVLSVVLLFLWRSARRRAHLLALAEERRLTQIGDLERTEREAVSEARQASAEVRREKETRRHVEHDRDLAQEWNRRLDDFARLRRENLAALQALNLQHEDLTRRGSHPALGVVTLSELLATWAVHDLTHVHQLSRVMGHQYRDAVGPWRAYLGVLQCTGHSAP